MKPTPIGLSTEEITQFINDGVVRVEGAFTPELAEMGRQIVWKEMGLNPKEPSTWTKPVVRLTTAHGEALREAANTPRLRAALDQLVGPGRWEARPNAGAFVVRFPSSEDPGDGGWHIDGSYQHGDEYWVNLSSRERALLMLFLFSDVGPKDAPTRIKVGSHLDVPPVLAPAGAAGMPFSAVVPQIPAIERRQVMRATGKAGDVYLCHPFLVHAAEPFKSGTPRFVAQPPLALVGELDLDRADGQYTPVEQAVLKGLATPPPRQ